MLVARRTFILGVAALIASPVIAKHAKFLGEVSTGELRKLLYRAISRMSVSCAPRDVGPVSLNLVQLKLMRGDHILLADNFHPLNGFLWVGLPGEQMVVDQRDTLRVVLEPCYSHTSVYLSSNIEPIPSERPKFIAESYRWIDGKPTLDAAAAMSYRDADAVSQLFEARKGA